MDSNTGSTYKPPSHDREIAAILGTFEFVASNPETDPSLSEALLEVGETDGPQLLPSAAVAQIRAASQLVGNNIANQKKKAYAQEYLKSVEHGRNRLESETIKTLSTQLQSARKADGRLMQVEATTKSMLANPKVGTTTVLNLGAAGKATLKIEGWKYADGTKFYAPQGDANSVAGCKRFMSEHIDNDLIRKAIRKREMMRNAAENVKAKTREIANKLKAIPSPRDSKTAGEVSKNEATATMLKKTLVAQERLIEAKQSQADSADELVDQRRAKALNAAMNYVKDANLNSRELESTARENRLNEKESQLRSASQQLEETAEALKRAHDTRLVENFPIYQAEVKKREQMVRVQEMKLDNREKALNQRARILAAKMKAFESGVQTTITNEMNSAGAQANKGVANIDKGIANDVNAFEGMLSQVNSKFATGKGAQIADKVATALTKKKAMKVKAVRVAAKKVKVVKKAMGKATEKAQTKAAKETKALKTPGGINVVKKNVDTADTKSIAKINDDVMKAKPSM